MNSTEINFDDDLRYVKVKIGLEQGKIKTLEEIFEIIPVTHIARKLNLHSIRFNAKIKDPSTFRISELQALAKLIGVDFLRLINVIYSTPNLDTNKNEEHN